MSVVFEDRNAANQIVNEIHQWSEKFTRLTVIEKQNEEYSLCMYQDPQISKTATNVGLYRTGMIQSGGYEQVKPLILEKSPLLQIAFAKDVRDMNTYEQISQLISMRKCRIISENDLKRQEFFWEKTAEEFHKLKNSNL